MSIWKERRKEPQRRHGGWVTSNQWFAEGNEYAPCRSVHEKPHVPWLWRDWRTNMLRQLSVKNIVFCFSENKKKGSHGTAAWKTCQNHIWRALNDSLNLNHLPVGHEESLRSTGWELGSQGGSSVAIPWELSVPSTVLWGAHAGGRGSARDQTKGFMHDKQPSTTEHPQVPKHSSLYWLPVRQSIIQLRSSTEEGGHYWLCIIVTTE